MSWIACAAKVAVHAISMQVYHMVGIDSGNQSCGLLCLDVAGVLVVN
nr:hypothetical protein [uncultured Carboxylicivirga sp.]